MKLNFAQRIVLFIAFELACPVSVKAVQGTYPTGSRSKGIGNVSVMLSDAWSGLNNPSGLAVQENITFAFHYENHFLLPEMGSEAFSFCVPTGSGTFALKYSCYGYHGYRESKTGLAYGKSFGEKLRAGIELNYLHIHQGEGYGNFHTVIPGMGIQLLPVANLIIALHIYNPAHQKFSNLNSEPVPVMIRAGAGYRMAEDVLVCFEMITRSGNDPAFLTGLEYLVSGSLYVRMGIRFGEYTQASFGIGFRLKSLQVDIAASKHNVLGYSPAVSIAYSLEKNR